MGNIRIESREKTPPSGKISVTLKSIFNEMKEKSRDVFK